MQVCKEKVLPKCKKITSIRIKLSLIKQKLETQLRLETNLKTPNTEMLFGVSIISTCKHVNSYLSDGSNTM